MLVCRYLFAIVALLTLTGCKAPYARVKEHPLRRTALFVPRLLADILGTPQALVRAIKAERKAPVTSLAQYLTALEQAEAQLKTDPNNSELREAYNFALSRLLATVRSGGLDPWTQPLRVPASGGDYVITHELDPRPGWQPWRYDLVPASDIDISGAYVGEHVRKAGLGAPLVAIGKEATVNSREHFETTRVYYGVTAIARFDRARRCVISFEDPLQRESTKFGGSQHPLAADFTAPLAFMLAKEKLNKLELSRLLKPEKYDHTECLAKLQPYDPNKTIVIVVHGLQDSQATWVPMLNNLSADPLIRQKFQFWFFSYPTGYPYPYSAALLRREMDQLAERYPQKKPMVVIGHSMGGCISRLLVTDAEPELWKRYFGGDVFESGLRKESVDLYKKLLNFKCRRDVGRVVFIAAPLRGSNLAISWVGRVGSRLVRLPVNLVEAATDVVQLLATMDDDFLKLKRIPTSVDTLAPNNRFVVTVNTLPIADGVPYHSIMGDRGKGGNPDQTKPMRSDGVVPYWSSRLPGAQSELVVPSGHNAHKHPQAMEEVRRILHLHAGYAK
jgi:pimeloyl-ACP methyl ester carboxylesterase